MLAADTNVSSAYEVMAVASAGVVAVPHLPQHDFVTYPICDIQGLARLACAFTSGRRTHARLPRAVAVRRRVSGATPRSRRV